VEAAERKAKAEADRIERERLAEELRVRKLREAAEEAERKRIANKKHREKVEDEAHNAIAAIVDNSEIADRILNAIKSGGIPNITINY